MARRGINGREAARLLGFHFTLLSNYVTGKRLPGRENAITIERMTGIPVEAWSPTSVGTRELAVAGESRKRR